MKSLLPTLLLFLLVHPIAADIEIHPIVWERNGSSLVPDGLMGVHATPTPESRVKDWGITHVRKMHWVPGDPTRVEGVKKVKNKKGKLVERGYPEDIKYIVDCFYDRYQAALPISQPKTWKKTLEGLAKRYGKGAAKSDQQHFFEFWNEPYLNWGVKPGVNYVSDHYETKGIQPGDPMVLKGTGEVVPGLEWHREIFVALNRHNKTPVWHMTAKIPPNAKEGEEVKLMAGAGKALIEKGETIKIYGQPHILGKRWVGRDPEQEYYWAGPVNVRLYIQMLSHFGPIFKKEAPNVDLAAGWGFNMFNANWESWKRLYKPTIDACHPYIDAIHEHHYGGDTKFVGMSYEVAYAYTLARYGKRLKFWNTEAGGGVDPEQPGNYQPSLHAFKSKEQQSRAAFTYTLRDISFLMAKSPEKAIFRAAHHAHHQKGDAIAFRQLKAMRGDLLLVDNPHQQIWAAAAVEVDRFGAILFNDHRSAQEVDLKLPKAMSVELKTVVERDGVLLQQVEELKSDKEGRVRIALPKKAGVALSGSWKGQLGRQSWHQYASGDILLPLKGGLKTKISTPAKGEHQVKLRLVVDAPHASLGFKVDGKAYEFKGLPNGILDLELGKMNLKDEVELEFTEVGDKAGRMLSASLWVVKA